MGTRQDASRQAGPDPGVRELPYFDENLPVEKRVDDLLKRLTLEEKIALLSKHTGFSAKPIPRLGIPEFGMTDGPHGCGPHSSFGTKNTYFPSAVGLAASWNRDVLHAYGQALAEETRAVGRHCILAPGINIHRSPMCGRNFEYFTEDPFLNAELVVPYIKGVQSKRIAACLKHFICNNSEVRRRFSNSIVGERALHEIYYPGFKAAVEQADPWALMGAYNLVNGKYVYEDTHLLSEVLQDQWGFSGFVVSDWFATHGLSDPAKCIKAGLALEMPKAIVYNAEQVMAAFKRGEFTEAELDRNTRGFLRTLFRVGLFDDPSNLPPGSRNTPEHKALARRIVHEGSVLLKNEGQILPINPDTIKKICITGPMAHYKPRINAIGGSSAVHPPEMVTPLEALIAKFGNQAEIVKKPKDADVVILVTGITHWFGGDCEGMDRKRLGLAKKRVKQIKKVARSNPNTIVILYAGSPVAMDEWIDQVPALLAVWQPHQEGGHAIAKLLAGEANPSGKLPTTFPKRLADAPAHQNERRYPPFKYSLWDMIKHEVIFINWRKRAKYAKPIDINYEEGVYVGYRYYDKHDVDVLFPFGFGLSYTTFTLADLTVDRTTCESNGNFTLTVSITNTGEREGAEVIQVYAEDRASKIDRPVKELVGFAKVSLRPGETQQVSIPVQAQLFACYDEAEAAWKTTPGKYALYIGTSSRNLPLVQEVAISA